MANERSTFFKMVEQEVERAYRKHGRDQWGRHEFYAVMKEEVDEVWDAIKTDEPMDKLFSEIIQVAAMCLRYVETGDRYSTIMDKSAVDLFNFNVLVNDVFPFEDLDGNVVNGIIKDGSGKLTYIKQAK